MLEFEEQKLRLSGAEGELQNLCDAISPKKQAAEIEELEAKTTQPGFWDNREGSEKTLKTIGEKKAKLETYTSLKGLFDDTMTLIEMADEEGDLTVLDEVKADVETFENRLAAATLATLLTGEYDKNNAILTFHAGAGGTEAQD